MCMSKAQGRGGHSVVKCLTPGDAKFAKAPPPVLTGEENATGLGTFGFDGCINYSIWSEF